MENWTEDFMHDSITEENREAFDSAMGKYESQEDAIVGGFNAMKMTGAPFRMPDSMDNLPDDNSRSDFTSQANKLLGHEFAEDVEGLNDFNLKEGLPEEATVNEELAGNFKKFIVDEKIPKGIASKFLKFNNTELQKASRAFLAKQETDTLANAHKVNEELIAHPELGSAEEVEKQSALMERAIRNHLGLTPEEVEEFAEGIVDAGLTKNAVVARVMLKVLAPLAQEGSNDTGDGSGPKPAAEGGIKEQAPNTAKALGW